MKSQILWWGNHINLNSDAKLRHSVKNMVVTVDAERAISIDKMSVTIPGAVYDLESFSFMIKALSSCSFLVFASRKI